MIQIIVTSGVLVIILFLFNTFINYVCGFSSSEEYGKVLEGSITIAILYLIILALFGNILRIEGIPFVDHLDNYSSFTALYQENMLTFVLECIELISLTLCISLISGFIPSTLGGTGFTGKVFRSIILVLVGIIVNNYFFSFIKNAPVFSWVVTALQCFVSGTSLVLTPAMLLGKILNVNPKSELVTFLIRELPKTKIGSSISQATTNSLVLIFTIILFESQYGSMTEILSQLPNIISLFAPLIVMIIGIKLLIKSVVN